MAHKYYNYYTSELVERLYRQRVQEDLDRVAFDARFEQFVKEERAKQGHYETNEWGVVCP